MNIPSATPKNSIQALRRFKRSRQSKEERCELCNAVLSGEHSHLLEGTSGQIRCACEACAILFQHRDAERPFLRIPRQIRRLTDFRISDAEWSGLMLPIEMAYILNSSTAGRPVAYYPSPAGPTESLLHLDTWEDLVRNNPVLERLTADVEALLINRTRGSRDYYIAPLDLCYKLTGLIRMNWRGLSGGDAVWEEIGRFFDALRERATETPNARS